MLTYLACIAIFAMTPSLYAGDKSTKPDTEPISRYQAMIDQSPFALATETAPPPPPPENVGFTKDLVLTGAVRLNGSEYITVESKDHNQRFSLKTGDTYNEISLVSVTWSDGVGKTKATLKKGTEFGTIAFDEAAARTSSMAPQPGNGNPGGGSQGPQPPANSPGNAQQPPQPPGIVSQPPAKGPGANPRIIRRVQPIPSAQAQ